MERLNKYSTVSKKYEAGEKKASDGQAERGAYGEPGGPEKMLF
jgi:hypothetical protein